MGTETKNIHKWDFAKIKHFFELWVIADIKMNNYKYSKK